MHYVSRLISISLLLISIATSQSLAVVVSFQPPPGTFQIRPELAGQHPRLFYSAADIPELRRRAANEAKFFCDQARSDYGSYLGQAMPDPVTGWKQYLYGYWGLTSFCMLAVTEDDQLALDTAKDWALTLSQTRWWKVDDLPHMDALAGLAAAYDILYHEFTEAERQQLREAIYDGATFIANRFFLNQYYTNDYQNNHMHNRMNALTHAAFAIYGDDPAYDVSAAADLAVQQARNMMAWLPEDGSQHEGPGYWSFGHHWAARVVQMVEHVTGEDVAHSNPHMENAHLFRIYMTAPGWDNTLNIGDAGAGGLSDVTPLFLNAAEAGDPYTMDVLEQFMADPVGRFFRHTIFGLFWYDATIESLPHEQLPLGHFWPDLEMFSIRSGWDDDAVAFVFKCGPVGGHKMQQIRDGEYVNVAHDHPDQNHFLLYAYGKMLAADDGYPKQAKLTANHNTIIIDGQGQPREGDGWQQPFDYALTGRMLNCFLSGDTAFATGDAAPCYEEATRFLRHAFFVDGRYAVLLDDLVSSGGSREFQWRLHNEGQWDSYDWNHFSTGEDDVILDIRFLNDGPMDWDFLPAAPEAQPCLAVTKTGTEAEFLTVLTPRRMPMAPLISTRLAAVGGTAVEVEGDGRRDVIVVAESLGEVGGPGVFSTDGINGYGVAAVVGFAGGAVEEMMLVRGTMLMVDGAPFVSVTREANIARRREGNVDTVEIAPPYKACPLFGDATARLGGFVPGSQVDVAFNDGPAETLVVDGEGTVSLDVDVSETTTIRIESSAIAGDVDGDGDVDLSDFVILKNNFGADDADWGMGDLNGDGRVDLSDFVILKNNFGA